MSTIVTVRLPLALRRQGCRTAFVAQAGTLLMPARVDVTMVKALARAFRWRGMPATGTVVTVREIAAAGKINKSWVSRVPRLTLLAPEIVEAVLDGRQAVEMTLPMLRCRC